MKILLLCTYPINSPAHGGQHRVSNIVSMYREEGHQVQVVGVLGSEQYDKEQGFVACPKYGSLCTVLSYPSLMEDYAIAKLSVNDLSLYKKICAEINCSPELIHIEQPWLFDFAVKYKNDFKSSAKLVYGSQNIEWKLKKDILNRHYSHQLATKYSDLVRELEESAIKRSDAVLCVSETDADYISNLFDGPIILAPNGVRDWFGDVADSVKANNITEGDSFVLYCASGHPPNLEGFFDIFSGGFGSLKPDEKLVVAGGVGWSIAGDARVHQSAKLAEKVKVAGVVEQPTLISLLSMAHCIVVPITQGGGTNLKTAEALWSGKYVVATTKAMRGFEQFLDSDGVFVTDDPSEFKRIVRRVMSLPPFQISVEDRRERSVLLWSGCLKPIAQFIADIDIRDENDKVS